MSERFNIVRRYDDTRFPERIILSGLTYTEAADYMCSAEALSSTCQTLANLEDMRVHGGWHDVRREVGIDPETMTDDARRTAAFKEKFPELSKLMEYPPGTVDRLCEFFDYLLEGGVAGEKYSGLGPALAHEFLGIEWKDLQAEQRKLIDHIRVNPPRIEIELKDGSR